MICNYRVSSSSRQTCGATASRFTCRDQRFSKGPPFTQTGAHLHARVARGGQSHRLFNAQINHDRAAHDLLDAALRKRARRQRAIVIGAAAADAVKRMGVKNQRRDGVFTTFSIMKKYKIPLGRRPRKKFCHVWVENA